MKDVPLLSTTADLQQTDFKSTDLDLKSTELVYDGFFKMQRLNLRHRLFEGGWSREFKRELFCRGDAVAGILYDPVLDRIGLIEQFRIGAHEQDHGPWCLEVVAGMMDKSGETPEEVMLRELEEEAGLEATSLRFICKYLSSPGGTDEMIHLFAISCDLSQAGGVHGLDSENEDIRLRVFEAEDVFAAMLNGRTNNAATLIGLQWLQTNRESLRL